ncbi:EAL domain-containing protein [Methylobacillus gramineus]|uniref:bifunctional diguanylate cyclase/phosphodiesterase n=1 Tax=Methylobacillus gramineus TaxID=755169 RepID=UPI001D000317|nr:EAL domain-containing protein [Methylobacillus gramineus]MCB5185997.1 EAL domain-containing protein [Methylobacillus gramineus]
MTIETSRQLSRLIILALAYFAIGRVSQCLPFLVSHVVLVWLPAGIAVAALVRWGMRYWPAIYAGAFLDSLTYLYPLHGNDSLALAFFVAAADTLAAVLTTSILRRTFFHTSLNRIRDIPLMVLAAASGMLVSAVAAALAMRYAGMLDAALFLNSLFLWWTAHVVGVLVLLPLLLNISWDEVKVLWKQRKRYVGLALVVFVLESLVFRYVIDYADQYMVLAFLAIPFVVLVAMRTGVTGASFIVLVLSLIAMFSMVNIEPSDEWELGYQPAWALWVFTSTLSMVVLLITALQSSRETTDRALRSSETKLRAVVDNAQDGIVSIDEKGNLVEFNQAAERMFGYSRADVIGQPMVDKIIPPSLRAAHLKGHQHFMDTNQATMFDRRLELMAMRADGTEFPVELTITSLLDKGVPLITGFFRDLTERRKVEQEIRNLAFFDVLTGLPNRRLLVDRLQQAIAASVRQYKHGAVMFIDLDDFKALNDSRGHDVGDLLLIEVAKRLRECVRAEDTVARLGGDEFVIILEDLSADMEHALVQTRQIAQKILDTVNQPYLLGEIEHHNSSSMGIALFTGNFVSMEELLKRSDTAMYQAKAGGRNTLRFFDPAMQAALEKRVDLELQLRLALVQNQLRMYCQVQVDSNRRAFGAEVLLRWQHPEHGLLPPNEFVGIAEDSGLIVSIGRWVLYSACQQLKLWETRPGLNSLQLAVNVSARQFRHADFVDDVLKILETTGANPSLLKLELTESVVLDNIADAIEKMNALRTTGVRFAMDDFGTGYSSLAYLKRLPLSQVKIDRSFVRDIAEDQSDAAIVQAIIAMSNTLGLNVIAEGVETEAQVELLEQYGCRYFQGYLFSQPLHMHEFERVLEANGLLFIKNSSQNDGLA